MLVLTIILVVVAAVAAFLLLLYLIEPSLLALPYTFALKVFMKNPAYLELDKYFPEHKILAENWTTIQAEVFGILKNIENVPKFEQIDKIQANISAKDPVPWRVFMLKAYENWMEANCAQAPKTTELLRQIPGITSAMFSIVGPRKHIPPHIGFYKGVFRYHLGLIVPKSGPCYIIVDDKKYQWKEGEDVLFDDTYTHSVYNESDETRVILFCDVYRNDLPGIFQYLNRVVFKMREKSKRLKRAVRNAEVQRDLATQQAPS